jgi:glucokinase
MTYHAGFDIGGTNARLSIFDDAWQTIAQARHNVRDASSPDEVAQTMRRMLEEAMLGEAGTDVSIDPSSLASIGVGIAGQLNATGTEVINAPNLGWRHVSFADRVSKSLAADYGDLDILIVNDLSALLWGEHTDGAIADAENVLAVYVGTGIGAAILADGVIVTGAGGKAGEIGHSKVVPGGRLCGCGERGCVEAYAGGVHLEKRAAEIAARHGLDEVLRPGESVTADLKEADRLVVDDLTAEGHQDLDELWDESTDYLAIVLANACTLLNPAVLMLGGGVLDNLDEFRGRLLAKTSPLVLEACRHDLEIRFPELGDEAGVLGAARLAALEPSTR